MAKVHLERLKGIKLNAWSGRYPVMSAILRRLATLADEMGYIYMPMDEVLRTVSGAPKEKYRIVSKLYDRNWLHIPEWDTPRFLLEQGKVRHFRLTLPMAPERMVPIFKQRVWDTIRISRKTLQEVDRLAATNLKYSEKSAEVLLGEIAIMTRLAIRRLERQDRAIHDENQSDKHSKLPQPLPEIPE